MVGRTSDWKEELRRFLKPFLDRLGHKARRQMCPLYVSGLIGPGDRKSIQPMAERLAFGEYDQLHHFIVAGVWDARPVETELLAQSELGRKFPWGGGIKNSGIFKPGPLPRTHFPQNSENFFLLVVDAQGSTAAGDCCGEVSRSNRGSFLVAKSNAGGSRARGRQPRIVKIRFTRLTRRLTG
jgi:hypothetical protein